MQDSQRLHFLNQCLQNIHTRQLDAQAVLDDLKDEEASVQEKKEELLQRMRDAEVATMVQATSEHTVQECLGEDSKGQKRPASSVSGSP